jgi:hypothetical protein
MTLSLVCAIAAPPPDDLARRVAAREAESEKERSQYAYRQTVSFIEIQPRGGLFKEVREVIFLPGGERSERTVGRPADSLARLKLTPEDHADLRDIQPLLLTPEMLPRYEIRYRGEETLDGVVCWALEVKPRQVFQGQRYFEGMLWAAQEDFGVARMEGQAVPPLYKKGTENLFPRFTTFRERIDGKHWFPVLTFADDTLPFKGGGQRIRLEVRYEQYKRFGAESKITFEPPK